MSSFFISLISFASMCAAALLGVLLRARMPNEHLAEETRDVVKLSMGLVATVAALVIGLLVASAKEAYDTKKREVTQMSAKIAFLDRELAQFGPQTSESRSLVRQIVERMIAKLWSGPTSATDEPTGFRSGQLYDAIQKLSPQNDLQQSLKNHALADALQLSEMRWLLYEQSDSSVATPLLIVVTCWLALLFFSFALFAPRNITVVIALIIAALAVSSGILLILELDRPFDGFIQISNAPMRQMLSELGR